MKIAKRQSNQLCEMRMSLIEKLRKKAGVPQIRGDSSHYFICLMEILSLNATNKDRNNVNLFRKKTAPLQRLRRN